MSIQDELESLTEGATLLEQACDANGTAGYRERWRCRDGKMLSISTLDNYGDCMACNGTGRIITGAGQSLLDFLARHWGDIERRRDELAKRETSV